MSEYPQTAIIISAYNEESGLPLVLEQLSRVIRDQDADIGIVNVIVVDDGSSDRTGEMAAKYDCRVISHSENRGKGRAMQTGIAGSGGQNIVFIDADGTYPVEEVPRIIRKLKEYDAVFTARDQQNIPRINVFGNRVILFLIRIFSGFAGHDPLSGLYGIRRSVIERLDIESEGFAIETEIAVKTAVMGFKTTEIPIKYERRLGLSKLNPFSDGWKILKLIGLLAVRYNSLATFIMPGKFLCLMGLFVFLLTVSGNFYLTSDIILGVHAFIFGAMAFLVGFQIIVQGVILDLYAVRHKYKKPDLVSAICRPFLFRWLLSAGLVIWAVGAILALRAVFVWAESGFRPYFETRQAVTTLLLNLFGLQLIFSSLIGRVFIRDGGKSP